MIDLDKIIDSLTPEDFIQGENHVRKVLMKEAIRKALELAAEQAKLELNFNGDRWEVDKDSIKNVINEVKG